MSFRRADRMALENKIHSAIRSAFSGRGSYPIPLDNATTAAFLGRTERGPINEPILVSSFAEYCRYFGGHFGDGAVSQAVHDYFAHGGQRAVVVRVGNRAIRGQLELPTGTEPLRLRARNPGRREILRASIDYEQSKNDDSVFNLVVQRLAAGSGGLVEDQEIYPLVSTRPSDPRFVANVLKDSRLVVLDGPVPDARPLATPPDRPGDPVRYVSMTQAGDDGEELTDYDIIGSDRDATGMFAFAKGPRIDLLAIPLPAQHELGTTAYVAAARFCEQRRVLFIWDPPATWDTADAVMLGARRLNLSSDSVMTYFPRIRPRGSSMRFTGGLPASGAIAGMLAQRDRRGVWSPDAVGDLCLRSVLTPVVDVETRQARRLARYGFNSFVRAAGGVSRLVGGVTLAAAGPGPHLSAGLRRRRLQIFILNSIEDATRAVAEGKDVKQNLPRLEGQLKRFFDELYQRGALAGRRPEQAYFLRALADTHGLAPAIRFGFALDDPGRFAEYAVELDGPRAGLVTRVRALEAAQLFS